VGERQAACRGSVAPGADTIAYRFFKDEYDMGIGLTTANYDVTPQGRFILLRRDARVGNLRILLNGTQELKQILARAGQ
jgi:hypothetical protein